MLNEFDKKIILNILSDYDIKGVFSYKSYGFLQYCLFVNIEGFTLPLFNSYIVDVDKNNKDDLKTYCEKSKEQIASRVREFESHPPFDKSINPHELFKLTSFIFNITNITTHKFKFSTSSFSASTQLKGDTNFTETGFSILRLGDST